MKKIKLSLPLVLVFLLLTPSLVFAAADDPRSEGETVDLKKSLDFSLSSAEDLHSSLGLVVADDFSGEDGTINRREGFDASPSSDEDLQEKSSSSAIEGPQAWERPCNQGAPCSEGCGPEGFCSPFTGCCMCY